LRDLAPIIDRNRRLLKSPVAEDKFLSATGQIASHAFLANSTQSVYTRQIEFLAALLKEYYGRDSHQIRVLDWGCGKGHITYLLRARGFSVTSCDIDSGCDDSTFGQETPILDQLQIQVTPLGHPSKLPFNDASFDCVVSFGVLEHVASDKDSLAEIRRILRLRGVFYVAFLPYFLSWTQAVTRLRGDHYHDRLYKKRSFMRLAGDAHFSVCRLGLSQLFPKNSVPLSWDGVLEPVDRFLCDHTPLKYFATNLEAVLVAS
jgi:SAM-dependent methyltransferase